MNASFPRFFLALSGLIYAHTLSLWPQSPVVLWPQAGSVVRGEFPLEWVDARLDTVLCTDLLGRYSVKCGLRPYPSPSNSFQFPMLSRLVPNGEYELSLLSSGVVLHRVERVRMEALRQIIVLGPRSDAGNPGESAAREPRLFSLFQILSRETQWGQLNAIGAWGRYATEKWVRGSLQKASLADLVLVVAELEAASDEPFRFVMQQAGAARPAGYLEMADLTPLSNNAFFLFLVPPEGSGGKTPGELSSRLTLAGLKHLVAYRPEKMEEDLKRFFNEKKGKLTPSRPWQDLDDLRWELGSLAVGPGPGDLGPCPVRLWRWKAEQSLTNIETLSVEQEVTNASSATTVVRNLVAYEALQSGSIGKVRVGVETRTNITRVEGHWETPEP